MIPTNLKKGYPEISQNGRTFNELKIMQLFCEAFQNNVFFF